MKRPTANVIASLSIISVSIFSGCSGPQPVLYPNHVLQDGGTEQAEQDIAVCEELAEEYVKKGSAGEHVAGQTVGGGAVGAASGAVGGAIAGNVGLGSAIGAAVGATQGLLRGIFTSGGAEANPTYRKFVNRCLREKGYEPIGWE
ncbi:MAG: hypothetical protein NPIRA02_05090 [Nitrospirales bacterium]|nr:MAG: hypothetical protein NPIRA02_05090 [Nitrospirales bacterium]